MSKLLEDYIGEHSDDSEIGRRPNGYWRDWKNCERELKPLIGRLGRFPNRKELGGNGSLYNAIFQYHGGRRSVMNKLGLDFEDCKKQQGYWRNINNVMMETKKMMKKHNLKRFPSSTQMGSLGYNGLATAINDYHGGFAKIRDMLGEEPLRKDGVWQDLEYVKKEIRKVMRKNKMKRVPSQKQLNQFGYSSLAASVVRYHGGFRKFREIMGEEQRKIADGLWADEEYVIAEAKKIMRKFGKRTFPSFDFLIKAGYSSITAAIQNYHGGMHNFREKLGEKNVRVKMGAWRNLDYTLDYAKDAIEKEGWEKLPCHAILVERGYNSLGVAIQKYHGGYPAFRSRLERYVGGENE